jgi:hypothetical protein
MMIRRAVLGLVLLLALSPAICFAQAESQTAPAEAEEALPTFGAHLVSGEAVVDLADFVSSYLEEAGTVPDMAQVQMADGSMRSLSAAEAFVLLARTAYLWEMGGALPETVPISPDQITPPVLDLEDVIVPPSDPEEGREVPTEPFLGQCPAVVRWVDRLQVVPTAVWVDGQRLSASEYMAGLAICVSYAYWEGELYASVFLPPHAPPQSWSGETPPVYSEGGSAEEEAWQGAGEEEYGEEYGGEEEGYEEAGATPTEPLYGEAPQPAYEGEPTLAVLPEPGATVSGLVDVVASYAGPPPRFVVFDVDARSSVIINFLPYVYRWDTSALTPGTHTVRVQVLGDEDRVLADQSTAYEVVPPEGEGSSESGDDL